MASYVDRLRELTTPPSMLGPDTDWERLQAETGLGLPDDYKAVIASYGAGCFDEFIWLLQPRHPNRHLDLVVQRTARIEALRELASMGISIPYDIEPGNESLIPWPITDNADVCYWLLEEASNPESWTVVLNDGRGEEGLETGFRASAFLYSLLSGELAVSFFPDDFPSALPTFVPA